MFPRNARAGATLEVMRATALQTMRFFVYPVAHEAIHRRPAWEGTAFTKAVAGAACALPEALIITPMEVAKLGLQLDGRRFQNSGVEVLKCRANVAKWRATILRPPIQDCAGGIWVEV